MSDNFLTKIQETIGNEEFARLEIVAEKEVAKIMGQPLIDQYGQKIFYYPFLLPDLTDDCRTFEKLGLKISPLDICNVLFKSKLLRASKNEEEYVQRVGRVWPGPQWREKSTPINDVINKHFNDLEIDQKERTLLSKISFFRSSADSGALQYFFRELFLKLEFPFTCFFEGNFLIDLHKQIERGLKEYSYDDAERFFSAPSIGFTCVGTRDYCYWYAAAWLKTFLNLLRVVGFIHPGQMEFQGDIAMIAPTSTVFQGEHTIGCYRWHEDEKESWMRIPDGCLFLSFGYRGLQCMWLDTRTFGHIEKFFQDHKLIFSSLQNPWESFYIDDVSPTLDILSSAAQIPDIGAKLLLIYCSLEHLFVPKGITRDNKSYIIGAINALNPEMLPWFQALYELRCNYAHKGFVLKDQNSLKLIKESMKSIIILLVAKLAAME